MLGGFLQEFISRPRCRFKHSLLVCITFYPIFNSSKYHFQKNSLWTGPAAKNTSINCREKDNKNNETDKPEQKQVEVLRTKQQPKNYKFSLDNIKQKKRVPISFQERCAKQKQQEKKAEYCSGIIKPTGWFLWVNPNPVSFFINCCYRVAKFFFLG